MTDECSDSNALLKEHTHVKRKNKETNNQTLQLITLVEIRDTKI